MDWEQKRSRRSLARRKMQKDLRPFLPLCSTPPPRIFSPYSITRPLFFKVDRIFSFSEIAVASTSSSLDEEPAKKVTRQRRTKKKIGDTIDEGSKTEEGKPIDHEAHERMKEGRDGRKDEKMDAVELEAVWR